MFNNWFQQFEAEMEQEVGRLFEDVCAKKSHCWALVSRYLDEESAFQNFLDRYEVFFRRPFSTRAALEAEERALRRQIERSEREQNSLLGLHHFLDDADDETEDESPDDDHDSDEFEIDFDAAQTLPEAQDVPVVDGGAVKRTQQDSLKKRVAREFLWMYHPRRSDQSGSEFMKERSDLITRLMNHPLYDVVEIMLRLPFTDEDRAMWGKPLPREGSRGETESIGERWYRYRLWNRLLDVALPKAEKMSGGLAHALYPKFQEMQRRGLLEHQYFPELETEILKDIEVLEKRIARLRDSLKKGNPNDR